MAGAVESSSTGNDATVALRAGLGESGAPGSSVVELKRRLCGRAGPPEATLPGLLVADMADFSALRL